MADVEVGVQGTCAPEFSGVAEIFSRNFAEYGEVGAAVAICIDGKSVVDLWGGMADSAAQQPWTEDTLVVVWSATKGMSAICMHMLADRGLIDFDQPVAAYWPEFGANGKSGISVAMALSHQAGVPLWQEKLPPGAAHDADFLAARLALEVPIWEPGTAHGYHAVTIGVIEGELVRRITGQTIGSFLRKEVADPLGADVWIGLPDGEEQRVATTYMSEPNPQSPLMQKLNRDQDWFLWKIVGNTGDDVEGVNSRARHAAEIPATGGIASARGLARLYSPLARDGSVDGVRLVRPQSLHAMRETRSASDCDLVLRVPSTFTLGFSKCWGARGLGVGEHVILGQNAFGTPGLGGSIGFADSDAGMSFGYVMNRHGSGVGLNERGQGLVDAAYRSLGFNSSAPGFWVR